MGTRSLEQDALLTANNPKSCIVPHYTEAHKFPNKMVTGRNPDKQRYTPEEATCH